jgi:hypothetical protein
MVAVARDYSSPTAKHNILPAAAMHTLVPRWVIHVISSEHKRLPLHTQLQTFRCMALSDALGHKRKTCSAKKYPGAHQVAPRQSNTN